MRLLFAAVAALIALVLGGVLYGWRYRDNGARPGDPSWRELERVDAV